MAENIIDLDPAAFQALDDIAGAGEHPVRLARAADIDPVSFLQFLLETGRATHPVGLLLWAVSLARAVAERASRASPMTHLVNVASISLVGAGLTSLGTAIRGRSWRGVIASGCAVSGGLCLRHAVHGMESADAGLAIPMDRFDRWERDELVTEVHMGPETTQGTPATGSAASFHGMSTGVGYSGHAASPQAARAHHSLNDGERSVNH